MAYVEQMWNRLEGREDTLTRQVAEKRNENALVTRALGERGEQLQILEANLAESQKKTAGLQEEHIRRLLAQVHQLENAALVSTQATNEAAESVRYNAQTELERAQATSQKFLTISEAKCTTLEARLKEELDSKSNIRAELANSQKNLNRRMPLTKPITNVTSLQ